MIFKQAMDLIVKFVDEEHGGNILAASRALGMNKDAFYRWYKKERTPNSEDLGKMLDLLGAKLLEPKATEPKEVCFIDAKTVEAGEDLEPPVSEDYFAVPLVDEVGAGSGYIPQEKLKSWLKDENKL